MSIQIEEILSLSVKKRLELIEEIRDSIASVKCDRCKSALDSR